MKSLISTIALAVLAISSFATTATAQEGGIVAVLDVAEVFKVNQGFDLAMQSIKTKAESLKAEIQQRQEIIKEKAQGIASSGYDLGSPQRNELEGKVEQDQAALRTWARQQEAQLLNEEAQVYFNTYKKMQSVVSTLAQNYNISLVMRYDGSEVSAASRPEVIKAVNRSVVYHKDIDLTNMVIKEMGPRVAQAPGAAQAK